MEQEYETLHEATINWIAQREKGMNNHYFHKVKIDNYVPDVIVGEALHEIEVVSTKSKLQSIKNKKVLWIVVPSYEVYNEINVVGQTEHGNFAVLSETKEPTIKLKISADQSLIQKALSQCRNHSERIYLLRVTCDLNNDQIAEILNIAKKTVETTISRLRKRGVAIPDKRTVDPKILEQRIKKILASS